MMQIPTLVCFMFLWLVAESCRCISKHPQSEYCNSDFVFIGRVRNSSNLEKDIGFSPKIYELDITEELKCNNACKDSKKNLIHTASSSAACGAYLENGKSYVLVGNINDGYPWVGSCGFVNELEYVTKEQLEGFRTAYKIGCSCTIEHCFGDRCDHSKNTCKYFHNRSQCYSKHLCTPNDKLQCEWNENEEFARCLKVGE